MDKKKNGCDIFTPPVNEDDVVVAQVYKTMNYDKFKFIDQNRETDHVNALMVSFQKRDVPNAILCNENYEIIDGQNRFKARKNLGLPIYYYCVSDLDIYDVAFLNSYGKNWGTKDFVSMWSKLGKTEYAVIEKFKKDFPDFSLQIILLILSDASNAQKNVVGTDSYVAKHGIVNKTNHFKEGLFTIKDVDHSYFVANAIMKYKGLGRPGTYIYTKRSFVSAMIQLLRKDNFDNNEMVKRAEQYPTLFYRCVNATEYINMLENLWNYKRRNRVHFEH